MLDDLQFRLALLVVLGVGLSGSAVLRRRADRVGGALPRSADRPGVAWALRIAGVGFYGALLLWLVHPPLLAAVSVELTDGWRWLGAGLFAGGVSLALWALLHLGRNVTPTARMRDDAELIDSGPYRWVRHPLYSSMLLTLPGCTLLTANLAVLVFGLSTFAVIVWRTRYEERELIDRFGQRYLEYRRRTGRLIPWVG